MKYTHIIWDFNGTILDDVQIGIDSVNVMLEKRTLPTIESTDRYKELFGFPIIDYYRRCGFDFERDDYESVLAPEWVAEYNNREEKALLCKGIRYALDRFKQAGISQSIVSASSSDMLRRQIERLGIAEYFESIIGCDNIYAYGKEDALCRYVSSLEVDQKPLMVGDTTHDAEAARTAGIDCVLLLCGHMNEETLKGTGCALYPDAEVMANDLIDII